MRVIASTTYLVMLTLLCVGCGSTFPKNIDRVSKTAELSISADHAKSNGSIGTLDTTEITCIVANESQDYIQGAIFTVSDMDEVPNAVDQISFGRVNGGETQTKYAHLPTGYEAVHVVVTFSDGSSKPLIGTGQNVTQVRLHITPPPPHP